MREFEVLRNELQSEKQHFIFLDAAQLIKHAFALRTQARKLGTAAKPLYLYAEPKTYPDGRRISEASITGHRNEISLFAEAVASDRAEVECFYLSYAELFSSWLAAGGELEMHAASVRTRFSV